MLLAKACRLALELHALGSSWAWIAPLIGVAVGAAKAKIIFTRFCQRNLDRIYALEEPRFWQFFRPRFFFMLAMMITAAAVMSRLAHNSFNWLVFVATLDFSLAAALLGSMPMFFRQRETA